MHKDLYLSFLKELIKITKSGTLKWNVKNYDTRRYNFNIEAPKVNRVYCSYLESVGSIEIFSFSNNFVSVCVYDANDAFIEPAFIDSKVDLSLASDLIRLYNVVEEYRQKLPSIDDKIKAYLQN